MKNFAKFLISLLVFCFFSADVTYGQVAGQVPLRPTAIPQFVDPLPHFAGNRVNAKTATDVYVTAVPHTQVAVSTGTKLATGTVGVTPGIGLANLWVYQVSNDNLTWTPPLWPAFTIETERGHPLNVHYSNELGGETYSKVGLVVDPTLHAAEPLMNPAFVGAPPITVHLHGGEVPPWSDGGPDSWFMPGNPASPRGHSYVTDVYSYPNTQEAATLWYHDHTLGATRLNVYAGMAGFYFLRDGATEDALQLPGWSGDDLVQEVAPAGTSVIIPKAPYLPELEVVIQDRMFDTNGGLYFPNLPTNLLVHPTWTPEFVGDVITVNGKTWPYLSVAPRKYRIRLLNGSNARFYNLSFPKGGPTITQIGTDGGFLDTPVALGNGPLLIAPGERADIIIDFTAFSPVKNPKHLLKEKIQSFILSNDARTPFPGGGVVAGNTTGRIMQFVVNGTMVSAANIANPGFDLSVNPTALKTNVKLTDFLGGVATGVPVVKTRQLTLNEVMGAGGPLEVLVNNTKWSGLQDPGTGILAPRGDFTPVANFTGATNPMDFTYYSETVDEGTTEIWQIINLTADAHPIHLHLVQFQLMSRQPFNVAGYNAVYNAAFPGGLFLGAYGPPLLDYNANQTPLGPIPTIGGNPDVTPHLIGAPLPANLNEQGWKDTYIMYPGEVTTIIARWAPTDKPATAPASSLGFPFDPNGGHGYVWHCHIIDHEDNEMMRPYNVIPNLSAPRYLPPPPQQVSEITYGFELEQNYPNPFSGETQIRFTLPNATDIQLILFNSVGAQVQTLIDAEAPAGLNTVRFNAGNLKGGIYFYQLRTGNVSLIKRMVVLK